MSKEKKVMLQWHRLLNFTRFNCNKRNKCINRYVLLYNRAEPDRVNRFILRDRACFLLHSGAGSHWRNVRGGARSQKSRICTKNWWLWDEWRYIVTAHLWDAFIRLWQRDVTNESLSKHYYVYLLNFISSYFTVNTCAYMDIKI